jgi:deoxyuridine 5'-triphosphate nucleotidohydrolase
MKIAKIRNVKTPSRGTALSAGIDFYIPEDLGWEVKTLRFGESMLFPSGIIAKLPKGYALIALNKSGIATKKGLQVKACTIADDLQIGACVVDEDYQDEIHIHVTNTNQTETHIKAGEKIIQFVLVPVFYDTIEVVNADELFEEVSERGSGKFGSTGTT